MKRIILSIFIISLFISCSHKLNSKVEEAVNKISEETVIYPDWETTNEAFENLFKAASLEDLIYLTENENSFVRYYAFIGLREKKYSKILEIYNKHKNNTETIYTSNGACIQGNQKISILMLRALNPENSEYRWLTKTEYDKFYDEQVK